MADGYAEAPTGKESHWRAFMTSSVVTATSRRVGESVDMYRARLRRFVLAHRETALSIVSVTAELEEDALQAYYSDVAGFLVRLTQAELERRVRLEARRRMEQWEKVCLHPTLSVVPFAVAVVACETL